MSKVFCTRSSWFQSGAKRAVSTRATNKRSPRPGNVEGSFYVDHTCIDCDTCRWMAPSSFDSVGAGSAVVQQPETKAERVQAIQALLSCPTFSIHMGKPEAGELAAAQAEMPLPVDGCQGVFHCGFHDAASFGATTYLIVRPEGNIMVDSPRFNPVLAKQIEAKGGAKYMMLTHIDDIGDHAKWEKHFKLERIIHKDEVPIGNAIAQAETQLTGPGPWNLNGDTINDGELDGGVAIIHTPGHTSGSVCLWHEQIQTMFTGDHLGYSNRTKAMTMFPRYNDYSLEAQVESVQKLLDFDMMHILPGHGRRQHIKDASHRLQLLNEAIEPHVAAV